MLAFQHYTLLSALALLFVLGVASWTDIKSSRIPNRLVLSALSAGFLLQLLAFGLAGALAALGGFAVGFGIFFPAYLLGTTSAGDVKLIAAVGTFFGPYPTLIMCLWTLVAGAFVALFIIIAKGGVTAFWKRYSLMLMTFLRTTKVAYIPPARGEAAGLRFPYVIAIDFGVVGTVWSLSLLDPLFTKST